MGNWLDGEKRRKYFRDRYDTKKRYLIEMLGGKCSVCGTTSELQFHHNDPDDKLFSVTVKLATRKWELVLQEASKCSLLCFDCHIEEHGKTRRCG